MYYNSVETSCSEEGWTAHACEYTISGKARKKEDKGVVPSFVSVAIN